MVALKQRKTWLAATLVIVVTLLLVCGFGALLGMLSQRLEPRTVDTLVEEPAAPLPAEPTAEFAGIVASDGPAFEEAARSFSFNGVQHSIQPRVANEVYWGAFRMQRVLSRNVAMNEQALFTDFYRRLTFDPAMDEAVDYVCALLRGVRDEQGFDTDAYAEFIIKYVQSIPYDYERLNSIDTDEVGEGDPRMPVQTLVDGTGDCDEKVMLAVALLIHEGYDSAMLLYEEENHMALGLRGDGPGYRGSGYEFVEMTAPTYISEMPTEIAGIGALVSEPMFLTFVGGGALRFSQEAVDEIAFIISARDSAMEAAEAKRLFIESTPLTDDEFAYHLGLYEACFFAVNSFQFTVNDDGSPNLVHPFLDRQSALAWLAQNYWWE